MKKMLKKKLNDKKDFFLNVPSDGKKGNELRSSFGKKDNLQIFTF